ncbi:MAG: OmpA family protein [Burkholderiales bacterium]
MKSAKIWVALSLLGMGTASAQADDINGWYAGAGIGQSRSNFNNAGIAAGVGSAATAISSDSRGTAYKLFGGYKFNPNFALEGGYFNLGKFGLSSVTPALNGTMKVDGWNLDALGILPMSDKFSFYGRLGLQYANTRDSFTGTGVTNTGPSKNATNYKAGLGLQYDITPSAELRGEWETYRISDAVSSRSNINVYSVSLVFPFGSTPKPVAAAAPVPAPEPTPAPQAAEAPAAAPEQLTLSAGSLFDFDKADVKPEGRQSLDKLATDLQSVNYDAISVTGHSDRIGSDEYNMKLSVRRAESVKKYLVDAHGIAPTKIFTTGKGKTDPVTKPGECKGTKKTKKLIECLQPDRRVVVEVSGTKR